MSEIVPTPVESPTEHQPPAPHAERQSTFLDHFRGTKPAVLGVALGLITAGARASSPDVAAANKVSTVPTAEIASVNKVALPKITDGETLDQAKNALGKKFKYVGETDGTNVHKASDKKHQLTAKPGSHLKLVGWAKQKFTKKHGKVVATYPELPKNAKVKAHSSVYAFFQSVPDKVSDPNTSNTTTGNDAGNNQQPSQNPDNNQNNNQGQNQDQNPNQTPNPEKPKTVDLKAEMQKDLDSNTGTAGFLGNCTVSFLRRGDPVTGPIIGAATAVHCVPGYTRVPDPTTGQLYMYFYNTKFELSQGSLPNNTTTVTHAKQLILPPEAGTPDDDRMHDTALIVGENSTAQEVEAANMARRASNQEIDDAVANKELAMAKGYQIYKAPGSSTWAQGDPQTITLNLLGRGISPQANSNGTYMPTLWTSTKIGPNEEGCFGGDSGAQLRLGKKVTQPDGSEKAVIKWAGDAFAGTDLRPAGQNINGDDGPAIRQAMQSNPSVNPNNLTIPAEDDMMCAFSVGTPGDDKGLSPKRQVVNLLSY